MSDPRVDRYNSQAIGELSDAGARARLQMLDGCGWRPEDGDVPGYFKDRQAGHRVLWSVIWATREGLMTPERAGWALNTLTVEELRLEAEDIVNRPRVSQPELSELLSQSFERTDPRFWAERMQSALGGARNGYPDYVCGWSIPPMGDNGGYQLRQVVVRPGWASRQAVIDAIGGVK